MATPRQPGAQAIDWLQRQEAALLPIPYFHLVFTLPHWLHPLIRQNRRALFQLLGNRNRAQRIQQARQCLGVRPQAPSNEAPQTITGGSEQPLPLRCPHCGADALVWVEEVPRGRRWSRPVLVCDSS